MKYLRRKMEEKTNDSDKLSEFMAAWKNKM